MPEPKFTAEQVIGAIEETRGMLTLAARHLGCSPRTIYNYRDRYASVQQAIRDERERTLDIAELALFKAVQEGQAWAICFLLKTQGKDRGYVERQELRHDLDVTTLSDEQLRAIATGSGRSLETKAR